MPGNTSHTFFDQLVEVIEQAQREAEAAQRAQAQRASQADVDKARREMAREKMEAEQAEKERAAKEKAEKEAAKTASKTMLGGEEEESKSPLGEKFDARKMVIYSEIMNPKYKD